MLKKIDLFLPPNNNGVLKSFTVWYKEAFSRAGIEARLLEADYHNPGKFYDAVAANAPDCTLSFNGLLPDDQGRFFCDLINIPHVACLVDSANRYVKLIQSKRSIVGCSDRFSCQFFQGMGHANVLFLPHAVNRELAEIPSEEKKYELVFFGTCFDYEAMRLQWATKYPTAVHWALHEAAEEALRENSRSYVEIFAEAFDRQLRSIGGGVNPREINLVAILQDLEDYINAKDRLELIKNLEGVKIDIFGDGTDVWNKYLGNKKNVTIHPVIPYEECLKVARQALFSLNSCPSIRLGGHIRVFESFVCNAVSISSDSSYLRETFTDRKSILFYQYGDYESLNKSIQELVKDEPKRAELVQRGKEVVLKNHTVDHRVEDLLSHLPLILESIKEKLSSAPMV